MQSITIMKAGPYELISSGNGLAYELINHGNEGGAPQYLVAGEKLWNGAEVSHCLAVTYNSLTDRIEQFKAKGRRVPEELLNGRHNLIASA